MKKIMSVLLVLTLIICALGTTAFAKDTAAVCEDAQMDGFYTEEEVFDAWKAIAGKDLTNYAGMYIDDSNVLHILFVEESDALKYAENTAKKISGVLKSEDGSQKQSLLIQGEKYSYETLITVMDCLTENAYSNKAVRNIALDVKNNRIDVGVTESCSKKEIAEYLNKVIASCNAKVDPDILSIHAEDDSEEIQLFAGVTVNGNSKINKKTSTTITYATVGVGYYRYSTGQRGFITCGHGFSNGDTIYSGNTKIGTIKKRVFNGTCDASFVLFDSEDSYVSNTTPYEELSWDVPIVGRTVTQRGSYSGNVSGEVTNNNFSYTGNGYTWTNLIKTDGVMQNGDSGGGMKCGLMDGGRTSKIVGFLHGGTNTYSVYVKGSTVSNALNS